MNYSTGIFHLYLLVWQCIKFIYAQCFWFKVEISILLFDGNWCVSYAKIIFNPFVPNAPFLHPMKTSWFSDVFIGSRKGALETNDLTVNYSRVSVMKLKQGLSISPLQPCVAYLYPLKTSKPKGFLMFSGCIDKQHWAVMG